MRDLILPRFSPDLEQRFQEDYYARVRPILRIVLPLLSVLVMLVLLISGYFPVSYDVPVTVPRLLLWSFLFAMTWVQIFQRIWQPVIVLSGWIAATFMLGQLAPLLTQEVLRAQGASAEPMAIPLTIPQQKFYFLVQFAVLLVSLATLRLQFRWATLLYSGVTCIAIAAFLTKMPAAPHLFLDVRFTFLPGLMIVLGLQFASYVEEHWARRAFLANHQLEVERNDEKRKREQTEKTLHVLAQAIGGIVHDLGNPLTTVQMGAQTLNDFIDMDVDKETLKEFTSAITDGSQMLNYLRLSLIEQTRVLEGKPIPLTRNPSSIYDIVQAGARFQKPYMLGSRSVHIELKDARVFVDDLKMVTVFMNLIGNALKYSDGEVRVEWREFRSSDAVTPGVKAGSKDTNNGDVGLLIAVLDQGKQDQGITQQQASQLFKAFGRLETHAAIEGTGLGLLSVQKIVEAHGGEVFIEGYQDGTLGSPPFSTAQGHYPAMLRSEYRTAFVITCPVLAATSSH